MIAITPLISIITIVRNADRELENTIQSVLSLNYPNIEFIIIDGGSEDGTVNVIKAHTEQIAYWISEPDKGIYDAMNKGLAKATGEWVSFMNAGDVFNSPQILSQVFSGDYPDADVIYGDGIADYKTFKLLQKAITLDDLWKGMPFCHQAMFTRTAVLKTQGFSTEYAIASDFELVYRLYDQKRNFHYVPHPICIFEVQGVSNHRYLKSWKERHNIFKKYGKASLQKQLFYASLFIVFLLTFLGYAILPRKLMYSIVKSVYRKNLI